MHVHLRLPTALCLHIMGAQAVACCHEVVGAQAKAVHAHSQANGIGTSSSSKVRPASVLGSMFPPGSESPNSIGIHRVRSVSKEKSIGLHRLSKTSQGTSSPEDVGTRAGSRDTEKQPAECADDAEHGNGFTNTSGERAPLGPEPLLRRRSTREGMCARQILKDLAKNTTESLEKYDLESASNGDAEFNEQIGAEGTDSNTHESGLESYEDGFRSSCTDTQDELRGSHANSLDTAPTMSSIAEDEICDTPSLSLSEALYREEEFSAFGPRPIRRGVSHDFFYRPEQTVIILDWDDTLFPTTWLDYDMNLNLDRPPPKRDDILQPLRLVISRAQEFAKLSCKLSRNVIIVTLAKAPWVTNCMRNFAPSLAKTLQRLKIPIVYARKYEKKGGSDAKYDRKEFSSNEECLAYWTGVKAAAIHAECTRCYSQYEGQTWKNVISIGDSYFERDGTRDVVRRWCEDNARTAYQLPRTKTVKFLDDPTCDEVADQLKLLTAWLPVLVRKDGAFNIDLDTAGASAEEDISGLHQLINNNMGFSGDPSIECPEAALIDGHLWKLIAGGDPLEESGWFRRRMWLSKSGRLWYESLKWVKWAQFFPEVFAVDVVATYALDGVETTAEINGTKMFTMRLQTSSRVSQGGDALNSRTCSNVSMDSDVWLNVDRGLRTSYLGTDSEQIRDDWITAIASFGAQHRTNSKNSK